MTTALVLTGAGLLLIPVESAVRRRLNPLAGQRLPGAMPAARGVGRLPAAPARWAHLLLVPLGWLAGPIPGALSLVAAAVLSGCVRMLLRERARAQAAAALSEAVAGLVAEHSAGASFAAALSRVAAAGTGPYRQALARAGRLGMLGGEPADALSGEPGLARIAVATDLVARTGVAVGEVLTRVRADLAAEQRARQAVSQAVAGPRSSAVLLAVLPVAGIAMGATLGARPQHVLLRTPLGLAVLTAGVLLDLAGLCWTLRLTNGVRE